MYASQTLLNSQTYKCYFTTTPPYPLPNAKVTHVNTLSHYRAAFLDSKLLNLTLISEGSLSQIFPSPTPHATSSTIQSFQLNILRHATVFLNSKPTSS